MTFKQETLDHLLTYMNLKKEDGYLALKLYQNIYDNCYDEIAYVELDKYESDGQSTYLIFKFHGAPSQVIAKAIFDQQTYNKIRICMSDTEIEFALDAKLVDYDGYFEKDHYVSTITMEVAYE